MLNDTDRFRCPANVAARVLDGEAIMIHLESGRYYSAEGVAATLWSLLDGGSRVGSIVAAVAGRFDVPPDRAREDVERFVAELLREELLVVGQAADVTGPADVVADFGDAPYSAPTLHAYRDMADLLALDPPMPSLKPMR
jgi:hypothetical protein